MFCKQYSLQLLSLSSSSGVITLISVASNSLEQCIESNYCRLKRIGATSRMNEYNSVLKRVMKCTPTGRLNPGNCGQAISRPEHWGIKAVHP